MSWIDELDVIEKEFVDDNSSALTSRAVRCKFENSRYRRLCVKVLVPAAYPQEIVRVEMSSKTLCEELLPKLQTMLEKEAHAAVEQGDKRQVLAVLKRAQKLVNENLFLYCWDEVRLARQLLGPNVQLKVNERRGTLKFSVSTNSYRCSVSIEVPPTYPVEPPTFKLSHHNFHESIERMFIMQASDLLTKLQKGHEAHHDVPSSGTDTEEETVKNQKISSKEILDFKRDMKFIKVTSDLKKEATADKKARGTLKYLTRKEREKMLKEEEKEKEAVSGVEPKKSLYPLIHFLTREYLTRLPEERCQLCDKRVLPANPTKQGDIFANPESKKFPMRVHCGHWYHFQCLDEFLTTPPFTKPCKSCGRRVTHSKWDSDVKRLERRWAMEQARKRELGEIADFLCIDDEHKV